MLEKIPSESIMTDLLGKPLYDVWLSLCSVIDERYDMERSWNNGGKKWIYEYKYRKGGKTLCSLYARENCLGYMIIFGKDECLKFEENRESYSAEVQIGLSDGILHQQYQDENEVYHTILHEIGHSLGLGHSPYDTDIMYTPHKYGVVSVSQRDALSLQWLYKLPYGISVSELAQKHAINSSNIDEIIFKIANKGKSHAFEDVKNSIKLPKKDLLDEQDKLAEIRKYNLGIQDVKISSGVQEYIKKNIMMKKDKK